MVSMDLLDSRSLPIAPPVSTQVQPYKYFKNYFANSELR